MAHYALLNENNIVTQVFVGRNEDEIVNGISDWEAHYTETTGQRCLRTSYNRNIRKHYAGIGFIYDETADEFVAPQPFPSWLLDSNNDWQPPTPMPSNIPNNKVVNWNESTKTWDLLPLAVK